MSGLTGDASGRIYFGIRGGPQQSAGVFSGRCVAADDKVTEPVRFLYRRWNSLVAHAEVKSKLIRYAPVVLNVKSNRIDVGLGHGVPGTASDCARSAKQHTGKTVTRIGVRG